MKKLKELKKTPPDFRQNYSLVIYKTIPLDLILRQNYSYPCFIWYNTSTTDFNMHGFYMYNTTLPAIIPGFILVELGLTVWHPSQILYSTSLDISTYIVPATSLIVLVVQDHSKSLVKYTGEGYYNIEHVPLSTLIAIRPFYRFKARNLERIVNIVINESGMLAGNEANMIIWKLTGLTHDYKGMYYRKGIKSIYVLHKYDGRLFWDRRYCLINGILHHSNTGKKVKVKR